MNEIEFIVDNAAIEAVRGLKIEANFQECEAALTELVAPYASMVVTEDGLSAAKSDRAKLRKIADTINDYKKTVKAAYSKPIKDFEEKCKALMAICDSGASNLDSQIKGFEAQTKQRKIDTLSAFFFANIAEYADFLSFKRVFNPRWENSTYRIETAQDEILAAITKCKEEVETIRSLGSEFGTAMLEEYARNGDLNAAMRLHTQLTARKEAEERKREEMERMRAAQAPAPLPQTPETPELTPEQREDVAKAYTAAKTAAEAVMSEQRYTVGFRVTGTRAQIEALGAFLREQGMEYGRI